MLGIDICIALRLKIMKELDFILISKYFIYIWIYFLTQESHFPFATNNNDAIRF